MGGYWIVLIGLGLADIAQAGEFHACLDASGGRSYQSLPCAAGQRTLATRQFESGSAAPRRTRTGRRAGSGARASGTGSPLQASVAPPARVAAYSCRAAGAEWVQATPCAARSDEARAGRDGTRRAPAAPAQRPLSRREACREVRQAGLAPAPGERAAQAAYRRNMLRDRAGC